jgi:hypothetical protein
MFTYCECGGQSDTNSDRIKRSEALKEFDIDDELKRITKSCRDCGKGEEKIFHGTHIIKVTSITL